MTISHEISPVCLKNGIEIAYEIKNDANSVIMSLTEF